MTTPNPFLTLPELPEWQLRTLVRSLQVPEPNPKPGRPRTYTDTHLLRLHVYRVLMGWSVERMLRELRRDPSLRRALGLPGVPGRATVSERSKHLPWRALWQRREREEEGAKRRVLGLDATPLPAQATDPEARWGKDSRGQWVYGYKLHLLLDLDTGEVLALSVTPAHRHDGPVGLALVRGMAPLEGEKPSLLLADSAYDAEVLFEAAEGKGLLLLSGHNRRRGKPRGKRRKSNLRRLQRGAYRGLYRRRWELETVVGLLKGPLGLEACVGRVRGLEAVIRQVMAVVTAFSFVAQALARAALPIAWVARVAA
ncbi:transposase IS4 family protein (plasmid) [Thermus thermophilus SG0.5JP17-16]|uniref:Transposase IS4 family protein n=4 Tax=Bacteria TaxID=2 RepID=F6DIV8_THETG|nr:transposase IS4 family protein [Thermus thermophilus SG0.5JP17-16]